jgi:hypothetical protein
MNMPEFTAEASLYRINAYYSRAIKRAARTVPDRVMPAIIGMGGGLCILEIRCDRNCLADARRMCAAQCGARMGPCYTGCFMDYRGDCCDEFCQ